MFQVSHAHAGDGVPLRLHMWAQGMRARLLYIWLWVFTCLLRWRCRALPFVGRQEGFVLVGFDQLSDERLFGLIRGVEEGGRVGEAIIVLFPKLEEISSV